MAGSEDKAAYNQVVDDRRKQYCSGWLMEALRVLEKAGMLSLDGVTEIKWPLNEALDEKTKSEVELNEARAMRESLDAYTNATMQGVEVDAEEMGLGDIVTGVVDLPEPIEGEQ